MVSELAYRVIKKAAILRINNGEEIADVVNSYTKLSFEQQEQLFNELAEMFGLDDNPQE